MLEKLQENERLKDELSELQNRRDSETVVTEELEPCHALPSIETPEDATDDRLHTFISVTYPTASDSIDGTYSLTVNTQQFLRSLVCCRFCVVTETHYFPFPLFVGNPAVSQYSPSSSVYILHVECPPCLAKALYSLLLASFSCILLSL